MQFQSIYRFPSIIQQGCFYLHCLLEIEINHSAIISSSHSKCPQYTYVHCIFRTHVYTMSLWYLGWVSKNSNVMQKNVEFN